MQLLRYRTAHLQKFSDRLVSHPTVVNTFGQPFANDNVITGTTQSTMTHSKPSTTLSRANKSIGEHVFVDSFNKVNCTNSNYSNVTFAGLGMEVCANLIEVLFYIPHIAPFDNKME